MEVEAAGRVVPNRLFNVHPPQIAAEHPTGQMEIGHHHAQLGRAGLCRAGPGDGEMARPVRFQHRDTFGR